MKRTIFSTTLSFLLLVTGCNTRQADEAPGSRDVMELSLVQASHLAALPLACMQTTYPNKLGQTLGSEADIGEPQFLHPAFYGCFDWHSAVHAHWSLVKLLKIFPELGSAPQILHISVYPAGSPVLPEHWEVVSAQCFSLYNPKQGRIVPGQR